MRLTPSQPFSSSSLARFSIHAVVAVSALFVLRARGVAASMVVGPALVVGLFLGGTGSGDLTEWIVFGGTSP